MVWVLVTVRGGKRQVEKNGKKRYVERERVRESERERERERESACVCERERERKRMWERYGQGSANNIDGDEQRK